MLLNHGLIKIQILEKIEVDEASKELERWMLPKVSN